MSKYKDIVIGAIGFTFILLCARIIFMPCKYLKIEEKVKIISKWVSLVLFNQLHNELLVQDVNWTSIQRFLKLIDVRWTSKHRRVFTRN